MLNAQTTSHRGEHTRHWLTIQQPGRYTVILPNCVDLRSNVSQCKTSCISWLLLMQKKFFRQCFENASCAIGKERASCPSPRFRKLPSPRHPCSGMTGLGYVSHNLELCWVMLGQRWVCKMHAAAFLNLCLCSKVMILQFSWLAAGVHHPFIFTPLRQPRPHWRTQ